MAAKRLVVAGGSGFLGLYPIYSGIHVGRWHDANLQLQVLESANLLLHEAGQ